MSAPLPSSSSNVVKPNKAITGPTILTSGRKAYTVNGVNFEVPTYVEVAKNIGFGAYGLVCSALDLRTNRKIAIKKCKSVFRDVGDGKRVLREVKILKMFHHENILTLQTFYLGTGRFDDVYIVTDLLDTDLSNVVRSKQKVSEDHVKYFIYQVLRGLKYVHSANVVHRDLKPQNILVNLNCDLKLCDFGLARGLQKLDQIEMTDYVVTRWYRPPELIMLNKHYGTAVDVWSTGCIFAEMMNRKALFPGSDYISQLKLIAEAIGVPEASKLDNSTAFENKEAVRFLQSMNVGCNGLPWCEVLKGTTDPLAFDFLSKMLAFSPEQRSSAEELMAHPYMGPLHDPSDEPSSPHVFQWEYDAVETISREQLRELFLAEAREYPDFAEHE